MVDKEEEDIVGKLEALRKRVPVEKPEKPKPRDDDERRKRLVRIVGLSVVVLFIGIIFYGGYKAVIQPRIEEKSAIEAAIKESEKMFTEVKSQKIAEIIDAFSGLPPQYDSQKTQLLDQAKKAETLAEVQSIDVVTPATEAWRPYKTSEAERKAETIRNLGMKAGEVTYRGADEIKEAINRLSYRELKTAAIQSIEVEFIPIRLSKREQAAGGFVEPGNIVNIYFKNGDELVTLAKNAKVMAVLRAKASAISLSESEQKTETGGGSEGSGTVPSLSIGSMGTITGPFPGSVGYKMIQSSNTVSVNINEINKAAAAGKVDKSYIKDVLSQYGVRLAEYEIKTGVGNFDEEFLMLLEVSEEEAPGIIIKLLSTEDVKNIYLTITKASLIEGIK